MQGLCHLISRNDLQYFGRTGAVETKNGNTNVAFGFFTQNGAATPCSSVPEELRQNSTKTAKKTNKNYNVIQNYHGHTHVTHFLVHADHHFLEKVASSGGYLRTDSKVLKNHLEHARSKTPKHESSIN